MGGGRIITLDDLRWSTHRHVTVHLLVSALTTSPLFFCGARTTLSLYLIATLAAAFAAGAAYARGATRQAMIFGAFAVVAVFNVAATLVAATCMHIHKFIVLTAAYNFIALFFSVGATVAAARALVAELRLTTTYIR